MHIINHIMIMRWKMRTTLDLPNDLILKAMEITHAKTKTDVIKLALENIIKEEKINNLIQFHGKVDLDIDLDSMRKR
jgi:Arc/MetJ family transcription regulator